MPEIITLTKEEANLSIIEAPEGFRFAEVNDFHNEGKRLDEVEIFVLYQGKTVTLENHLFTKKTSSKWLQWLLDYKRVFIRNGKRPGEFYNLNYQLQPTEDFLINQINQVRLG